MTSMASSIQPRPPAMSDLRSAGVTSRGQANPDEDWEAGWPGGTERPVLILCCLVSRVRSAVDSFRNFQDHDSEFQQKPHDEDTNKQSHNSHHQIDESLRGGMLHADHDAGHDRDSATEDGNDIEQLHDPTGEQRIE